MAATATEESFLDISDNPHVGGYNEGEKKGGIRGNVVWENRGSASTHWTAVLEERFWPGPGEVCEFRLHYTKELKGRSHSHWFAVGAAVREKCDGTSVGEKRGKGVRQMGINDKQVCARHSFSAACNQGANVSADTIVVGATVVCSLSYPDDSDVGTFCATVLPDDGEIPEGAELTVSSNLPPGFVPWIKVAGAEVTVVDCTRRNILGSFTKSASKH
jgi:hypothetical protein